MLLFFTERRQIPAEGVSASGQHNKFIGAELSSRERERIGLHAIHNKHMDDVAVQALLLIFNRFIFGDKYCICMKQQEKSGFLKRVTNELKKYFT